MKRTKNLNKIYLYVQKVLACCLTLDSGGARLLAQSDVETIRCNVTNGEDIQALADRVDQLRTTGSSQYIFVYARK